MTTTISGTSGVTYPSGGVDNVAGAGVGTTDTQTLTNKTLTSPTMTTPTIDSAQIPTVSGTAPIYMCRAWVNFNGTGTVAIRGSGNVSSITDNGVGDYTVNFTTAMSDATYSAAMFGKSSTVSVTRVAFANGDNGNTTQSASSYRFYTAIMTTGAPADTDFVNATFFR